MREPDPQREKAYRFQEIVKGVRGELQPQMRGWRPIGQFLPHTDPPFLMFFYGQKIG